MIKRSRYSTHERTIIVVQVALSAALLALCAWITIPIVAIPFTLQTFGIFTIILLFGWKRSMISITLYLTMGIIGLPVFSGFGSGIGILAGPTGGYLIGFFFTAVVYGLFEKALHRFPRLTPIALIIGMLVYYAFGAGWYYLLYANGKSIWSIIQVTILPFFLPDLIKLFLAIGVSSTIHRTKILYQ